MKESTKDPQSKHQPGESSAEPACSAPRAHGMINDRTEIRPFDQHGKRSGSWHYVHRTFAHSAVEVAVKEGVALFAAWLVDNADGEEITEELLSKWGSQCLKDNDPNRQLLEQI